MRKPTDRRKLYRFYRELLAAIGNYRSAREAADAGLKLPACPDDPQCGFYKRRMVRGGDWVTARIYLEQTTNKAGELVGDEVLRCQVGEDHFDPASQWQYLWNRPITEQEYRFGVGHKRWQTSLHQSNPDLDITVDFGTHPAPMLKPRKGTRSHDRKRPARSRA